MIYSLIIITHYYYIFHYKINREKTYYIAYDHLYIFSMCRDMLNRNTVYLIMSICLVYVSKINIMVDEYIVFFQISCSKCI